ncbi:MAG: heme-binding protein [Nitrospinae bacterium]|nr:heme-binding protein [Nitrospinota bacterium]
MVYFNSQNRLPADLPGVPLGTAVTNRTINFGAQPLYPPGIDDTSPGPFLQLVVDDVARPCSQGAQPPNLNESGIVFFAGSIPLYKNGQLVGGLGVSGDGVEQDDLASAATRSRPVRKPVKKPMVMRNVEDAR